ncbi:MAG: general secretion pathway protein GspB [Candidatus Omnitrophica bacterium]|nr:general secretion pathway protein GspB [Candidatus Omnitrophota bacterium]
MKKLYILICLQMIVVNCFAQQMKDYEYDSHGKRDPFVPLVGNQQIQDGETIIIMAIEDVTFQGVAMDAKGNRTAIINGQVLKEGSKVDALAVEKIDDDGATVTIQGKEYRLDLYEY